MPKIGELAKVANISVEAIRYYEKQGLIEKPLRLANGYRQYSDDAPRRLQFIHNAKQAGLSLKEIAELLSLSDDDDRGVVKALIDEKLREVDEKIKSLKQMKKQLSALSSRCDGEGSIGECPIIEAFRR